MLALFCGMGADLVSKQGLFAMKTSLLYNANKASLRYKQALFENVVNLPSQIAVCGVPSAEPLLL